MSIGNGHVIITDMEAELEPFLDTLRALPFVKNVVVDNGTKGAERLTVHTPQGATRFALHRAPGAVRAAEAAVVQHLRRPKTPLVVFASYVDPNAATWFAEHGIAYVDLVGNCQLTIGNRFMALIEKPGAPQKPVPERGWRPASYRVLFALLAAPDAARDTTRELAARAGGVSPQTAADVLAKLKAQGIVFKTRKATGWAPGGYRRALELWAHGFGTTLLPALTVGRFRAKERDPIVLETQLTPLLEPLGRWAWGGGAACMRLTGYFRGDQTVIYFEQPPETVSTLLRLVPDARGQVAIAQSPGPFAFHDEPKQVAHPLLAYVDLLHEHDERATEAAQQIYEQFIQPLERSA